MIYYHIMGTNIHYIDEDTGLLYCGRVEELDVVTDESTAESLLFEYRVAYGADKWLLWIYRDYR